LTISQRKTRFLTGVSDANGVAPAIQGGERAFFKLCAGQLPVFGRENNTSPSARRSAAVSQGVSAQILR
jgi:hypothetical protein